jgi:phosphoribosylformylglycinamidine synthase
LATVGGSPPPVDLEAHGHLVDLLVDLAARELVSSAHDVSDGGLAVTLAECCMGDAYRGEGRGCRVDLRPLGGASPAGLLFGEDQGRVVLSVPPRQVQAVLALASRHGVPAADLGDVGDAAGALEITLDGAILRMGVDELRTIYAQALPRRLELASNQD